MTLTLNELTPSEVTNLVSRLCELTACIREMFRNSGTLTVEQVQLWQLLTAEDPSLLYTTLYRIQNLRRTQKDIDVCGISYHAMLRVLMHGR
jgi:hypothetical protein